MSIFEFLKNMKKLKHMRREQRRWQNHSISGARKERAGGIEVY